MGTRYGLSLKLDMENAAFSEGACADEVARILRRLADKLEQGDGGARYGLIHRRISDGLLVDSNGNKCGAWEAKARRIRD